ncbi:hypothetical protein SAMN06295879_3461 [Agreia bicolorata]|uniref:Uncharacterized protein n=1 Tax=Agreia bicolorata TaxID=110935 RepID=A0A1T4YK60_9MICO|nr:hypothetical protein [Agreia bicolorata]SKB02162.1 hypothetical protein SAMN06295879_3461 [Agreia bicolorata]
MTRHRVRRTWIPAAVVALVLSLVGCAPEPPVPTGDELFEQARQHYIEYRTVTNDIQALIYEGPWEADIGSYGMQPSGAGCDDDAYGFDFTRTTRLPEEDREDLGSRVLDYLDEAGYEVEGQELGSGASQSLDLIVRKQTPFSELMVTLIGNGSVLVTAKTACWPGDEDELGELLFGDVNLSQGYLPDQESPTDPLFFGVTPGKPAFTSGS